MIEKLKEWRIANLRSLKIILSLARRLNQRGRLLLPRQRRPNAQHLGCRMPHRRAPASKPLTKQPLASAGAVRAVDDRAWRWRLWTHTAGAAIALAQRCLACQKPRARQAFPQKVGQLRRID